MPVRIRRRTPFVLAAALSAATLVGCVSPEKYNALRIERDGLNEQLARANNDSREARAQAAAWKSQLDALMANSGAGDARIMNLTQQITTLQGQLNDVTAKYNEALARIGSAGAQLPQELTNALTQFADQNPNLVEFDARTGSVKFKSDLTFASGDATLQPAAQQAIQTFAQILNSDSAKGYELMVCGHADNQKVSAPTMARGHKDNWYLSSHRALSVAEALQQKGVAPARIGAVGYGEYRPIASNDSRQGMAQNRRVEVLILPTQLADARPAPANPNTPSNNTENANVNNPRPDVTVQRRPDEDLNK